MLGDPNALYSLDRATQASVLGWWAASRFPEGWRSPKTGRGRSMGAKVRAESESAESFWLGGE